MKALVMIELYFKFSSYLLCSETSLKLSILARTCNHLDPPVNGATVRAVGQSLFSAFCAKSYFPAKQFAMFYRCLQGKWVSLFDSSKEVLKLDPCKCKCFSFSLYCESSSLYLK